jgi:hypothetical protein
VVISFIGNRDSPIAALRHPLFQLKQPPQASFHQDVTPKLSNEAAKLLGFPVGLIASAQSSQKWLIVSSVISYRMYTSGAR